MLATSNRLRSADDFRRCLRAGGRSGGPLVVVHLLVPDSALDGTAGAAVAAPRVGFVVSRAVGTAVTRNLVKRRLRHLVRERLADLPAGSLVVVRAQPPAATASYAELRSELERCLQRCLRKVA
ncbi:MAG TPA: ribonuclease P protein component [Marmoricola sp.]|nr:ribonuclease P protein component [Marmoricola sp.]